MPGNPISYCWGCGRSHKQPVGESCKKESDATYDLRSKKNMESEAASKAVMAELEKVMLSQDELDLVNKLKLLQQQQNKRQLERRIGSLQAELAAPEEEKTPSVGEKDPPDEKGGKEGRHSRSKSRDRHGRRHRARRHSRRRAREEDDDRSRSRHRHSRSRSRDSSKYSLRRYLRNKSSKEVRFDELVEAMMSWAYDHEGW